MAGNINVNKTTSAGMSPMMESILNRYVIEGNEAKRKYTQFAQKVSIPKGQTKTIAFDKMSPLPKATTPLQEGVTPTGSAVNITRIKAEPRQFGNYVGYTDQLDFFADKPSSDVLKYTDLLSENQLETYEHLDAMELASGTNVQYAGGADSRDTLTKGLTVKDVRKAATTLKRNKVKPADGTDYIAFIHPDVVNNIWNDEEWRRPHSYADTKELYAGEIGRLFGVRFIEDPDAWVFRGEPFADKYDELSIVNVDADTKTLKIAETLEAGDIASLTGVGIWIDSNKFTIASATAGMNGEASITLNEAIDGKLVARDMKIYPGDGGVDGEPIYSTIILGKDAFGTSGDDTVEMINKALGSAGTADPLNQRGTYGWKGYYFTMILEQMRLIRVESLKEDIN